MKTIKLDKYDSEIGIIFYDEDYNYWLPLPTISAIMETPIDKLLQLPCLEGSGLSEKKGVVNYSIFRKIFNSLSYADDILMSARLHNAQKKLKYSELKHLGTVTITIP